ncbi:MAG: prepilin-type N-terminal cleavage/methylation domain-containing protein [Alphaproteobacteria bacterium]|nr:prepilin-type N-terminal cleavage/methylation domain-containing protein [Alphaproteobacteria bacterium]
MVNVSERHIFQKKGRGFTLVEMSIVLVIIGIIIGGVIKSREMLRTSKIKVTLSEMNNLKRAAIAFRDKYGTYPGDFSRATKEVMNCISPDCENGDGDGKVVTLSAGGTDPDEEVQFWKHLFLSGLRQNEIFDSPIGSGTVRVYFDAFSLGGSTPGYMGGTGKHWLILEAKPSATCCLSLREQWLLDIKLDDGEFAGAVFRGGLTGNLRFFDPTNISDQLAPKQATGLDVRDGTIGLALD